MVLDPGLAGRTFPVTPPYKVSREKIAEFTAAIGAEPLDGGRTAPPTFPIVIAFQALSRLMTEPGVGIDLHNVVHAEQRFEIVRPVRADDELVGELTVDSVRSTAGTDLIATRTSVRTTAGEPVATALATLAHRAGAA